MLKDYLIKSYSYLVKVGRWALEPAEGDVRKVVPEDYRVAVAEYLAS